MNRSWLRISMRKAERIQQMLNLPKFPKNYSPGGCSVQTIPETEAFLECRFVEKKAMYYIHTASIDVADSTDMYKDIYRVIVDTPNFGVIDEEATNIVKYKRPADTQRINGPMFRKVQAQPVKSTDTTVPTLSEVISIHELFDLGLALLMSEDKQYKEMGYDLMNKIRRVI